MTGFVACVHAGINQAVDILKAVVDLSQHQEPNSTNSPAAGSTSPPSPVTGVLASKTAAAPVPQSLLKTPPNTTLQPRFSAFSSQAGLSSARSVIAEVVLTSAPSGRSSQTNSTPRLCAAAESLRGMASLTTSFLDALNTQEAAICQQQISDCTINVVTPQRRLSAPLGSMDICTSLSSQATTSSSSGSKSEGGAAGAYGRFASQISSMTSSSHMQGEEGLPAVKHWLQMAWRAKGFIQGSNVGVLAAAAAGGAFAAVICIFCLLAWVGPSWLNNNTRGGFAAFQAQGAGTQQCPYSEPQLWTPDSICPLHSPHRALL